jgi:hypothetical protein
MDMRMPCAMISRFRGGATTCRDPVCTRSCRQQAGTKMDQGMSVRKAAGPHALSPQAATADSALVQLLSDLGGDP